MNENLCNVKIIVVNSTT